MEIADVFAVNKSDRPGADKMVHEIVLMLGMGQMNGGAWVPPVIRTEATRGIGVEEVLDTFIAHQKTLDAAGLREAHFREFMEEELVDISSEKTTKTIKDYLVSKAGSSIFEKMIRREIDPYSAADSILPFKNN